ncbi:SLC13 family permease [Desulfogranum mediterraneum]|uniref:SLC13 family permease n=1 Tax=Desulfogranum mediterraneum TaxID=160661 RepID=UPI000427DB6E|nr:SLC13 family permease [Desulfogranum mediterraneum]
MLFATVVRLKMWFFTLCCLLLLDGSSALGAEQVPGAAVPFTVEMGLVFGVLGLAILLFVFEWVRVDVVGIIMMVVLPFLNLVTPAEAISGLSSNAVVAIIAVIIIGAGLDKTGCMNVLARNILRLAGKSEGRIMTFISLTVAFISSFMQNIGAAALFLPAVLRIGRQTGIPASRILMPMAYCAIIGGTITLVGASPTILLNDLIAQANELGTLGVRVEPLGLFTQTPIGIALVIAAIVYFMLFRNLIIPQKEGDQEDNAIMPSSLADTYQEIAGVFEVVIPDNFGSFTLEELHVRSRYHVSIAGVYTPEKKTKNYAPTRYELIHSRETLAMVGNEEHVRQCAEELGWIFKGDLSVFAEDFSPNNAGMVEGIVTPRADLVGTTMREQRFRKSNGVVPVVLCRDGACQFKQITREVIKTGDALLMFGRWEKFKELSRKDWFAFTTEIKGEEVREDKAGLALGWLALTVALILWLKPLSTALGHPIQVSLSVCLLSGALGMILSRVLSIDEAYRSIDWMTVFLLGGLIPLGLAFQKTGAAAWMATSIMGAMGQVPEIVFLLMVGILTSFFTLVVSNVGATVLLVPLSMAMAVEVGSDPRLVAMVVAIAASNTFVLPTHQVNALVMRPGSYQTKDYVRAGVGMTVLFLLVLITMLSLFY